MNPHYDGLPVGLRDGMRRYIEDGVEPGGFLTAVLANNLRDAVFYADDENLPRLADIVRWCYNEIPDTKMQALNETRPVHAALLPVFPLRPECTCGLVFMENFPGLVKHLRIFTPTGPLPCTERKEATIPEE